MIATRLYRQHLDVKNQNRVRRNLSRNTCLTITKRRRRGDASSSALLISSTPYSSAATLRRSPIVNCHGSFLRVSHTTSPFRSDTCSGPSRAIPSWLLDHHRAPTLVSQARPESSTHAPLRPRAMASRASRSAVRRRSVSRLSQSCLPLASAISTFTLPFLK